MGANLDELGSLTMIGFYGGSMVLTMFFMSSI